MASEARKIAVLKNEIERRHAVVSDHRLAGADWGPKGPVKEGKVGGEELVNELKPFENGALQGDEPAAQQKREQFKRLVTKDPASYWDGSALAVQKGFLRQARAHTALYHYEEDRRFHLHAGLLAENEHLQVHAEMDAQKELAAALGKLQKKFAAAKDERSARNTAAYAEQAESQLHALNAVNCELHRMTATDFEREKNMGALVATAKLPGNGQGAPGADADFAAQGESDITGLSSPREEVAAAGTGENGGTREVGAGAGEAAEGTTATSTAGAKTELSLAGPTAGGRGPASLPGGHPADEELDLFTRVQRKHREKEKLGVFVKGFLD